MAKNTIKGLTIEIGGDTTELGKALEDVNKKSRDLSSELGSINRLLKLDPSDVDLLTQKQKVLAEAIGNTEDRLDTLREAERQVQAQFEKGEVSEAQYRELQREIIATENKLKSYASAADDTQKAIDGIDKESAAAADDTRNFADAADDASKSYSDFGNALKKAVTFAAVSAGVKQVADALMDCVEATQEYRTAMGKLNTAFEANGHTSETATQTYKELQSVLGETDQAVEAANFLSILADNEEELQKWTQICTGVFAKFGDSLPVEGLAEAANETAKVGQVTGPLADALNWAAKEGETFGLKLKQNIDFTELSSSELKKLTDAQREEYEARKAQYDAIEEYNKELSEAVSAEDKFNIALAECSTEQERQELIMQTLSDSYSDIADDYKEVNKEAIESNKTTERLNELWAKVGKKATPIVNTFREGIAELGESLVDMVSDADIENFQDTIKDGFSKLAKDVLPKLIDALKWCIDHFNEIKSVAAGFVAALAVNKIANFAKSIGTTLVGAFKGLVGTLKGAKTAQEGMNAAASANPYLLLAEAIIGVSTALGSYLQGELDKARESGAKLAQEMHGLNDAEQESIDRANDVAEAYRNQRTAMDEAVEGIESQYGYVSRLKDQLLALVDADGKVDEANRTRVEFILGELNQALGTEYTMVQNQIASYQDLQSEIDNVIASKKNELLLEASSGAYAEALQNKTQAENDYYKNLRAHQETQIALIQAEQEAEELASQQKLIMWPWERWELQKNIEAKEGEKEELKRILGETETAYNNSKEVLAGYYEDIGQYETAQMLTLEGNTEEANRILSDRTYYVEKYADSVGFASDDVRNTWEQEAIDAGIKAELIKRNWKSGIEGYTEEMVEEAEKNYKEALDAMGDAYDDAAAVGKDITNGLGSGMESGRGGLLDKARDIVRTVMSAFRKEADSHSPSRKMIDFGEDLDEGVEIGLEKGTKPILKTAKDQMKQLLDVYDQANLGGQSYLRDIEVKQSARKSQAKSSAESESAALLAQILEAVKSGKRIYLDGDALVGATAGAYDSKLGRRAALAARGAV